MKRIGLLLFCSCSYIFSVSFDDENYLSPEKNEILCHHASFLKKFGSMVRGVTALHDPECSAQSTGEARSTMLDTVFCTDSFNQSNSEQKVARITHMFPRAQWLVHLPSQYHEFDLDLLLAYLITYKQLTCLNRTLDNYKKSATTVSLDIKKVTTSGLLRDAQTVALATDNIHMNIGPCLKRINLAQLEHSSLAIFVGYHNNKPTTTGMLTWDDSGFASIHALQTIPNQRRKGYARELLGHMAEYAKTDCKSAKLLLQPLDQELDAALIIALEKKGFESSLLLTSYIPLKDYVYLKIREQLSKLPLIGRMLD
jgi:hypothetical protein